MVAGEGALQEMSSPSSKKSATRNPPWKRGLEEKYQGKKEESPGGSN